MHKTHDRDYLLNAPEISGHWGNSVMRGAEIHDHVHATNISQITEASDVTDMNDIETLELSPWQISLQERFSNMIAQGHHSAALDLLAYHLENYSAIHAEGTIFALFSALNNLEYSGSGFQASQFANLLNHSGLLQTFDAKIGLDFDRLFNNLDFDVPSSMASMGVTKNNIQAAKDTQWVGMLMTSQSIQANATTAMNSNPSQLGIYARELGLNPNAMRDLKPPTPATAPMMMRA